MIDVAPLAAADRQGWEALARGYKAFDETPLTDADYDRAWQRLLRGDSVHVLGARRDGKLVGIAHYLFHAGAWTADVCYLQDLFVDPVARGHGAARALIEAIAEQARRRGAPRFYWLTTVDNAVARALYDKVAQYKGFIRYDHALE